MRRGRPGTERVRAREPWHRASNKSIWDPTPFCDGNSDTTPFRLSHPKITPFCSFPFQERRYTGSILRGTMFGCEYPHVSSACGDRPSHTEFLLRSRVLPLATPLPTLFLFFNPPTAALKFPDGNTRMTCTCKLFDAVGPPAGSPNSISGAVCLEARCMYGADGCTTHTSGLLIHIILGGTAMIISLWVFILGMYIIISLVKHKKFKLNAMGTTLLLNILSSIALFTWPLGSFVTAVQTGRMFRDTVQIFSLPAIAIFLNAACFNISLMWLQVGKSATSLKKSGSNIDKSKCGVIG